MANETEILARRVVEALSKAGLMLATAESCTGGLIAAALTAIPGSSAVFDRGFVTYSNAAKSEAIGVDRDLIERHGAVSQAVAKAMAEGALHVSEAGIAVSVTGIAGPAGGSPGKPVGLVHFACATPGSTAHLEKRYGDLGRAAVRSASVVTALELVLERLAEREAV